MLPDRISETEDQAGRVGRRLREVAGQERRARGRVAARRRGRVASETGSRITEYREGEPAEDDQAGHQGWHRVADDPGGDPAPRARLPGPLDAPGQQLGLAEDALEDSPFLREQRQPQRQQGRQQGQPGHQDHAERDGERDAQVGVEGEAGQQQGEHRGDHRARREGDGLANPGHRADDRLPGRLPGMDKVPAERTEHLPEPGGRVGLLPMLGRAQFLAHPEDQEQPVIRARAEHQHDHQVLRERGDLEAVLRRLGDQRPGDDDREDRGGDGDHGQRERPEDQHQQHDDEQRRVLLDLVPGVARRLLLVHLDRYRAGQMRLQPGGQPGAGDGGPQRVDEVGGRVGAAAGLAGQHDQLPGVPVRGAARVDDLADAGDFAELAVQVGHGRHVGRGQR